MATWARVFSANAPIVTLSDTRFLGEMVDVTVGTPNAYDQSILGETYMVALVVMVATTKKENMIFVLRFEKNNVSCKCCVVTIPSVRLGAALSVEDFVPSREAVLAHGHVYG